MSSMFPSGTKIQITGLQTAAVSHLNGVEGVVEKFSEKRQKYKVMLPQGPMMVNEVNMKPCQTEVTTEGVSGSPSSSGAPFGQTIFRGEEEMMERLRSMGMSAEQLNNLTPEQRKAMLAMTMRADIVDRAKNTPGVMAAPTELTMESNGLYGWRDVKTHVYLEMACDNVEGDVTCHISEDKIRISAVTSGATLLEGEFFQSVDVEKCAWEYTEKKIIATLTKAKPMRW
eukprot:CAMPEP_0114414360 /NCGR_PEP_ID=MMETSP0103-20121206/1347_1 /TAXON_ID=37642 ORGANISM="Paraphysomonas imperforata, Strain PA2" /NCGR_SAMPLE_ID=MMETSP0103 /ASSEMBLY_ACC=CAM_ASM_000201 /LENGTH=227 /DNA_ID=CAMNT_0001582497 /DNA_START=15 /DNA_END=695 /DNA_ORIENTATION=+